jgi:serine/threonine-protein kinase
VASQSFSSGAQPAEARSAALYPAVSCSAAAPVASGASSRADVSHSPVVFSPGAVVSGAYEVIRFLGFGSSAVVYQCKHRELNNHPVAMKVFSAQAARSPDEIQRFKHELLAAYQVNHPNVVRGYELLIKKEFVAFTMEYVSGGSLADRISEHKMLPLKQTADILHAVCSGLEGIHQAEIVHRDLKPANILITAEGNIKITDFGIAHFERGSRLTPESVLGTVEYISPEYIEDAKTDARSDIYSLGVIAYEMLAGRVPFSGSTPFQTLFMRIEREPEHISKYRSECPKLLAEIVMRALSRNPGDRYQSASEMKRDVAAVQDLLVRKTHLRPKPVVERPRVTQPVPRKAHPPKRVHRTVPFYQQPQFIRAFAATSLAFWLATVAVWFYYGKYEQLFAKRDGKTVVASSPGHIAG